MSSKYTPVIGIEIHVELATQSKMFCGCPADHFAKEPNTQTCPVCLGLPGALPVPNKKAVEWTIKIGKALNCHIREVSKFDRKHYFYPDLPKGYQISQYDEPLCENGSIKTPSGLVRIERVHLEEDTGKLQHSSINGKKVSLVDFNRSSVPLVEIVTKPDIINSDHAREYAKEIAKIVRFLEVSDADMEKGSMRLEANISLKPQGSDKLPEYKVEVKNINSFKYLKDAIEYEITRHTNILETGQMPAQETRGWNERTSATVSQRSKEEAMDYRYFPEPDIPPMVFSKKEINAITSDIPMLPEEYKLEFSKTFKVRDDYIETLTKSPDIASWSLEILKIGKSDTLDIEKLTNYLVNESVSPASHQPVEVVSIFKKSQSKPTASKDDVETWIKEALKENPDIVTKFKQGKKNVMGALIGDVMKRSKGQADPKSLPAQIIKYLE